MTTDHSKLIRNGIVGTVVVLLVVTAIVGFTSIPILASGNSYSALFSDASALNTGDDVEIAGSKVGSVKAIELEDEHVRVRFMVDSHTDLVGDDTKATIKVATVLGRRFIDLTPSGRCCLAYGATIPQSRTTSGFDVADSLSQVADTVADTNLDDLSGALDTTADVAQKVSPEIKSSLDGLRRLSQSISSRDEAFFDLVKHSDRVTDILSKRNTQLLSLFTDGSSLLRELNARSESIHGVLVEGQRVADQLASVVRENEALLGPTLQELQTTLNTLNKNYKNINDSIVGLANFATQLGDIVANGPFFSALIQNVLPATLDGQSFLSPGAPH